MLIHKVPVEVRPDETGRVSIYLADNGANFLAARIEPGPDFALAGLRGSIRTREFHFTGGEFAMSQRAREVQAFRDDETARLTALYPQQATAMRR